MLVKDHVWPLLTDPFQGNTIAGAGDVLKGTVEWAMQASNRTRHAGMCLFMTMGLFDVDPLRFMARACAAIERTCSSMPLRSRPSFPTANRRAVARVLLVVRVDTTGSVREQKQSCHSTGEACQPLQRRLRQPMVRGASQSDDGHGGQQRGGLGRMH